MKQVTLASAMTPFPYSIDAKATLAEAREMLTKHAFHHLPVTSDGVLTGVLRERDVALVEFLNAAERKVETMQVPPPYVCDIHTSFIEVLGRMQDDGLDVALITRNDKLVGILTSTDLARLLASLLTTTRPPEDEIA